MKPLIVCILVLFLVFIVIIILVTVSSFQLQSESSPIVIKDTENRKGVKKKLETSKKNVCVVTYDDRANIYSELRQFDAEYCKKHDYSHLNLTICDADLPPYWRKVVIVADLLDRFDYVMWVDSDACIHNSDQTIPALFPTSDKFLVISPDPPIPGWTSPFNSGVFIVKNCELAKTFFKDWIQLYNSKRWEKKNTSWHCNGVWAGEDYEQGAAVPLLASTKYSSGVKTVHYEILQSISPAAATFTVHFSGFHKHLIKKYIKMKNSRNSNANVKNKFSPF
jgi:hypothetical protein